MPASRGQSRMGTLARREMRVMHYICCGFVFDAGFALHIARIQRQARVPILLGSLTFAQALTNYEDHNASNC
jgi:hypothetical protein